jgi:hypothetical protein
LICHQFETNENVTVRPIKDAFVPATGAIGKRKRESEARYNTGCPYDKRLQRTAVDDL